MRVLVTGASGFLGRFLCAYLEKQGFQVEKVHTQNCDLTKENSLRQFDGQKFDRIYHLAAWTQAGDFCLYHPADQWMINQKINTNVLCWWKEKQPQAKIVCMGSSCSYDPKLSLDEKNYLEGRPIDSLFTYAMTKRMLFAGLLALQKQYGLDYLYFIPSTLYGPGYFPKEKQQHFIFDLVRKILKGKLYNEPVTLWGNGEQKRELIHIRDFVSAMEKVVDTQKNQFVNVGGGQGYSIKHFAKQICEITGYRFSNIQFDLSKYVGAKSKILSVDKLKVLSPDYITIPLADGLKELVEWTLKHKDVLLS